MKVELKEKSVSKAQQRFMGMVRATQKGEMDNASPEVKKAAATMSKKDVKDFASTKHKGLPMKKEAKMPWYANQIGSKSPASRKRKNKPIDRLTKEPHGNKKNPESAVRSGNPAPYDKKKADLKKKLDAIKFKREMDRINKESTDAYGKSQDAIANKKKHDAISQADRLKLAKLDALMKKQRKEEYRDPFKAAARSAKYKELSHEYEREKQVRRQKAQKSASQNKSFKSVRNRLEATYQGKKVPLNKPMKGDVKKSKVFVDPDGDGKAQKVNFGDKNMTIKKHIPGRRKSFRARHNCDNPGPKDKARYWSCKAW